MIRQSISESALILEQVHDPAMIARSRGQDERAKRNRDWLQAQWAALLARARGKFIAVAGQEAFIADTAAEAWQRARTAHPEDDGAISQYVLPTRGPRVYANQR